MRAVLEPDMSATRKRGASSIGVKFIAWSIAALGFLTVAYFAWGCLLVPLWHWANKTWWHWILAPYAFLLLLFAPIFALVAARPLIAASGAARGHLWWEAVSYVGALGVTVLIMWAFTPAPGWWAHWHWWPWGAAVVGTAIASAGGRMFCTVYPVDAPKVRSTYSSEWKFNHYDVNTPPALGIAMSGGGIRSAAFNLGVLHALHDNGLLRNVDIMSAVSGGSYAMSWYLLQPFYVAKAAEREHADFRLDDVIDEMFRSNGRFQTYLCRYPRVVEYMDIGIAAVMDGTFGQALRALAASLGSVGQFNMMGMARRGYRERLQTLFQGLPSPDSKDQIANRIDSRARRELSLDHSDFSCVTPVSYRELADFAERNRLPYFVFNATVLVQRGYRHMLWPTTFELTAYDIGSDVCGYRTWEALKHWEVTDHLTGNMGIWPWVQRRKAYDIGLRQHRWALMVNVAPAISGAAIGLSYFNPEKSSREVRLTSWTPFFGNLDLGYIFYREIWNENEKGALYVSDGGHSENLGAFALIKRQCKRIIIVDAEHEATIPYVFAGYAKLKRQLAQEMHLVLTVSQIDSYLESAKGTSKPSGPTAAVMTGEVKPMESNVGGRSISVIYIKLGLDRNRLDSYPKNVSEYARKNSQFPQDPTSNQAFTSEQFIAYRDLGRDVACNLDQTIGTLA